jgi:carbonic anhydrase
LTNNIKYVICCQHPLVPKDIAIYGYIYEVKTGRLVEIPQATTAGKPLAA